MRKVTLGFVVAIVGCVAFAAAGMSGQTRTTPAKPRPAPTSGVRSAATPPTTKPASEDEYLRWPLPPGAQAYGRIDGKHLHTFVVEQAVISRRYRDNGHPKFWGRIIGTSSDAESAEWHAAKFKALGMSDVRIQPFDLQPQWMPQSWDVT